MTNRDFLKQVSTDGLPDASTVLEGVKPRSVWRRVAVAVVAAAAIGAVVTVGAQVYMNELEQIEAQSGKGPITDLTQLETGKLYTIENHSKISDDDPRMAEYYYSVYNELPEDANPHELPMPPSETFTDDDENRSFCIVCHSIAWTPTDPVEYSYQRPSASEPETFNVRTLNCALCGYLLETFDADGKELPRRLEHEIRDAFEDSREVEVPNIEGLTLYDDVSQLKQDVLYRAFIYKGYIYFYESTPENNEKVSSWITCAVCSTRGDMHQRDFLLGEHETISFVDEYGDEHTYSHYSMICAKCGEESFGISD